MSLETHTFRSSAEPSLAKTTAKATGSYNGCDIYLPNRTQTRSMPRLCREDVARFWSKVERAGETDCWLWTASVSGSKVQHGQFTTRIGGRQHHLKAHRLAWVFTHGEIPPGCVICHRCDVARCVNPAHLFLGTQADNLNDARAKGRLVDGGHLRKLTPEQKREIVNRRFRRGDRVRLAIEFGVSPMTITRVRREARQGVDQQLSVQSQHGSVLLKVAGQSLNLGQLGR